MNKFYRILRYDWPLHFVLLITNWLPDNIIFIRLRGFFASFFFGSCGSNFRIGRNNIFYNSQKIHFGSDVYIAHHNWFCAGGTIDIGNEVIIGPYNSFVAANHTKLNGSYRYGKESNLDIKVGFGSWISSHCIISGDSSIGNGVLVAANSFVRGALLDNGVYAGSPAVSKKEIY